MSRYFVMITQEEADWLFARLITNSDEDHDRAYDLLKGKSTRLVFKEDHGEP